MFTGTADPKYDMYGDAVGFQQMFYYSNYGNFNVIALLYLVVIYIQYIINNIYKSLHNCCSKGTVNCRVPPKLGGKTSGLK